MTFKSDRATKPYLIAFILFCMVIVYLLFHIGYWYYSNNKANEITEELKGKAGQVVKPTEQVVEEKQETPFLPIDFKPLKTKNAEIVAWLKVGGVKIDLPITQTTNNEFYLNHDADKKPNKLGWVFADTRSSVEYLGTNTVLYGHNVVYNQMFGNLKGLMNATEETKKDFEYIQFTTPEKQMVFELTSVYVTDFDDWYYTQQEFSGEETKKEFIKRMREKNTLKMFDRDDLSVHDKFLTFSTCHGPIGTTKRLVVQARLVAEKQNEG